MATHKIFKYELQVEKRQMIYMPKHAMALSVVVASGRPYLYAQVDPKAQPVARIFRTVCAGEEYDGARCRFIDTFVISDWFVGHTFEELPNAGMSSLPVSERYDGDFATIRHQLERNHNHDA